jgi:hypothetical protein
VVANILRCSPGVNSGSSHLSRGNAAHLLQVCPGVGRYARLLAGLALLAAACGTGPEPSADAFHPDGFAGLVAPDDIYDPEKEDDGIPDGFRQILNRDAILPVYDPKFVEGSASPWPDEELVIGVFLADEARAYPVGFLNRREAVVDLHRGIPTFVTW